MSRTARFPALVARLAAAQLVAAAAVAPLAGETPPEFAIAVAAAGHEEYAACRAEFERVAAVEPLRSGLARRALYGAAVCAALGSERDAAFGLLDRAVALGFHDPERLYDDPRLRTLRSDPRWPELERRFVETRARWLAGQNAELVELAAADQTDRQPGVGGIDWSAVASRDAEREQRVRAILAAGGAKTPDDRYQAALVLLHGDDVEDFELAHQLAKSAAEEDADLPGVRWLAAATLDRALVHRGRPQKYGTQSILKEGRWVLADIDPSVTDAERAAWDVPPLAESRRRVEAMNAAAAEP